MNCNYNSNKERNVAASGTTLYISQQTNKLQSSLQPIT